MDPNAQEYLDLLNQDIFVTLGMDGLPKEEKNQLLNDMISVIQGRIASRVIRKLNDEDKATLDGILAGGEQNDVILAMFLQSKVPDYNEIAMEEIVRFKTEMVQTMKPVIDEMSDRLGKR